MEVLPGMVGSGVPQLQSTVSAASAGTPPEVVPHHPITCQGNLFYEEDGSFRCEHASVPPDNPRTLKRELSGRTVIFAAHIGPPSRALITINNSNGSVIMDSTFEGDSKYHTAIVIKELS